EVFLLHLNHRHVRVAIAADDLALVGLAVGELELDLVGALDDVVIGEDVALLEIDEEARAQATLAALGSALLGHLPAWAEEELEGVDRAVGRAAKAFVNRDEDDRLVRL